jgi:hypothetical protein
MRNDADFAQPSRVGDLVAEIAAALGGTSSGLFLLNPCHLLGNATATAEVQEEIDHAGCESFDRS